MPIDMKKCFFLFLLVCLVAACTKGNAVRLTYALGAGGVPCSGEITVFGFEDSRSDTALGKKRDGVAITSGSDVADWVGWALFDELRAAGCEAKYRTSTVAPGDAPLVTGEVLEVSLNQTGATTYRGKVTVRIMLQKEGTIVHQEKFTSEVEDVVLPGYGTESEIMAEALRGLMGEIVPTVCRKM